MTGQFDELVGGGSGYLGDARAMSKQEIADVQALQARYAGQAILSYEYTRLQAQYQPFPEKPLDERFADFKTRLAAAIARRPRA